MSDKDDLAAFRGVFWAFVFSIPLWVIIGAVIWLIN